MKSRMQKDIWLYLIIFAALVSIVVASVVGAIILAMMGQSTPEFLVALGSAAIGGLAGFLVLSHLNR